jgi:hypothetical protein
MVSEAQERVRELESTTSSTASYRRLNPDSSKADSKKLMA